MKLYIIKNLLKDIKQYKTIKNIKRVQNNEIKIEFEQNQNYFFDMTKNQSLVYKKRDISHKTKNFSAPFDILLLKKLSNSKIVDISMPNDDKMLLFELENSTSYKSQTIYLLINFVPNWTNVILLDKHMKVLEALRQIDTNNIVVKIGHIFLYPPKPTFEYIEQDIEDMEKFLYDIYDQKQAKLFENSKNNKLNQILKQIKKLKQIKDSLDDTDKLLEKSEQFNKDATKLIKDIHKQTGYTKAIQLKESNDLFKKSKKMKQKALLQHIEQNNIEKKLEFNIKLQSIINRCKSLDELEFYLPKKEKNQTKTKKSSLYQSFFYNGYDIKLGRNESENIYLLKNSKSSDVWFHLKDRPSSHLIVVNRKKELPQDVIQKCATIVAKFSSKAGGDFLVDWTKRGNVKIQSGANVLYNPYSTIKVRV